LKVHDGAPRGKKGNQKGVSRDWNTVRGGGGMIVNLGARRFKKLAEIGGVFLGGRSRIAVKENTVKKCPDSIPHPLKVGRTMKCFLGSCTSKAPTGGEITQVL